jgi:hypothetical protein
VKSAVSRRRFPAWWAIVVSCLAIGIGVLADDRSDRPKPAKSSGEDAAAQEFSETVRPLLKTYCQGCHSEKQSEAEINLQQFATLADVQKQPQVWQKVGAMLESGQMPPKDARQPTDEQRAALRGWVRRHLQAEARKNAGDPGPVVLRRLSNAEYTATVRDLTGIESLTPAREFPIDGAAGEGFTNTGNALVMSPALLAKYLDAGKEIAGHAVLLPDGFRFSPGTTRRDWTNEALTSIRQFYARFTDAEGKVALETYLRALLEERANLEGKTKTIADVSRPRGLNALYLGTIWQTLSSGKPSLLLDPLRAQFRAAKPDDAGALAAGIGRWQKALWAFKKVGHMKAWQEAASPLVPQIDVKYKFPAPADGQTDIRLFLVAQAAGDGSDGDCVLWRAPRIVAPGRPNFLLRDVRDISRQLTQKRQRVFASAAKCLEAAAEARAAGEKRNIKDLAARHSVETDVLAAWLDYLGIGSGRGELQVSGHFTEKMNQVSGYDFISGWGTSETPLLVANASDQAVRIPGNMKPHGVAVHPSPTLRAAIGWQSPLAETVRIEGGVTHAHPECGNGVTWSLELRRGTTRQRLATGVSAGAKEVKIGPIENLAIETGDLVSILIGPRDGNHACDLTDVQLVLTSAGTPGREWNLSRDVAGNVQEGNPHADRFGNKGVWHFYVEPVTAETGPVIPAGSLLARWQASSDAGEKRKLAEDVEKLLVSGAPADKESPDAALYRQLASLGGPLFSGLVAASRPPETPAAKKPAGLPANSESDWGLDPALFGRRSDGEPIDPESLCVMAPSVIEIRLPADLVAGCELVTTGTLEETTGGEGSVQLQVLPAKPEQADALSPDQPIVMREGSAARHRIEGALDEFRQAFPAAMCYSRIVPVDEAVTLALYHREDDQFARLMLDDAQRAKLNRLWDELHFVSHDALGQVDAFAQLMEYATQDSDPRLFEPYRKPIYERAAAFRQLLIDSEPRQIEQLLTFATRVYRRPPSAAETRELRALYQRLRAQDLSHGEAFRLTLARMLVAPAFLYRLESPPPGSKPGPVSGWEQASRLSYFLWSSLPDDRLFRAAADGRLRDPDVLIEETRRMSRDPRVRRFAIEFACQWLHIHGFDQLDEKSERHFPTFSGVRSALYEESIRFFTDLVQRDGSVLDLLDADYTFVNEEVAKHYGIPGITGPQWRRIDGIKRHGRGGILGMATILAKQSGASRTSPILRGNWLSEVLLGERLPRPPKDVPPLPDEDSATEGLTVRQLVEKHRSAAQCAVCHDKIDAFGFALEAFDAIGRKRDKDLGNRPIETQATLKDGTEFEGLEGLRDYLLTRRRGEFLRQFCRKLLGYALGRSVQLSDEPLLEEMLARLEAGEYRFSAAVEAIVASPQFRQIRGKDKMESEPVQ